MIAVILLGWWGASAFGLTPNGANEEPVSATQLTAPLVDRFILTIMQNGQPMLYAVDREGGNLENLDIVASDPSFSSAEQRLAYVAPVDGIRQIFVASTAANGIEQVTNGTGDKHTPRWSPDGQRLAYLAKDGPRTQVWLHDFTDDEQPSFSHDGLTQIDSLIWSPDGATLLVDGEEYGKSRVFVLGIDSGRFSPLMDFETQDPAWSPDGERIVVSSTRGLYTLDPDGGNMRRLNTQSSWSPTWSPDGKQIAFLSDQKSPEGLADLWVIDAAGGRATPLTQDGVGAINAMWMPDNSGIAFVTTNQEEGALPAQLWVLSSHGEAQFVQDVSSSHVAWLN